MVILFSHIFFHALYLELQKIVQLGGYVFPDISILATSIFQGHPIQTLRERAFFLSKPFPQRTVVFAGSSLPLLTNVDLPRIFCWLVLIILRRMLSKLLLTIPTQTLWL